MRLVERVYVTRLLNPAPFKNMHKIEAQLEINRSQHDYAF